MTMFWTVFAAVIAAYAVLFAVTAVAMRSKRFVKLITKWSMKVEKVFESAAEDL